MVATCGRPVSTARAAAPLMTRRVEAGAAAGGASGSAGVVTTLSARTSRVGSSNQSTPISRNFAWKSCVVRPQQNTGLSVCATSRCSTARTRGWVEGWSRIAACHSRIASTFGCDAIHSSDVSNPRGPAEMVDDMSKGLPNTPSLISARCSGVGSIAGAGIAMP